MNPILVTGASGELGRCILKELSKFSPDGEVFGLVRTPGDAQALSAAGLLSRIGSCDDPASLRVALEGVGRLLLVSPEAPVLRAGRNARVIAAAREAGVTYITYISFLNADRSPLRIAAAHAETEAMLAQSGIHHAILRTGWFLENLTCRLQKDLASGRHPGTSGKGRLSLASRSDYAAAAAVTILNSEFAGQVYELAGDSAISREEYTDLLSELSGREVKYRHLTRKEYGKFLRKGGMTPETSELFADCEAGARKGWLRSDTGHLSRLIGRPTRTAEELLRIELAK
ncbi:NAD(P)H-binding protein [Allosediminivita pacifica]|uniref:NAD(P)H dehydrogenase (Quinone) n=1 Tax=Allosediminivita pacifica TaxID=1267769 RepID=A0A2T6BAB5_9RHOB|nr:NAD(P)H-binding protein [Allosediminivita pacifica]PTX53031.1 NAD(P)H dehydrogenase (quinone) [Allosediminivita pacifica]GGA93627.1 NAD(P)-dependent oxidoreductase [Allosediminivita pacifica]